MPDVPQPQDPTVLVPGLVRLTAPNPSAMTFTGTNSYVLGDSRLVVIDPGPADPRHLRALLDLIAGRRVEAIVVTHAHRDHSGLAPALSQATGAPVAAFGPVCNGPEPNPDVRRGPGDGIDRAFRPDLQIADGGLVAVEGGSMRALHTPGHLGDHLCLAWEGRLFSGDHVMGWSTSIVAPPEGDMGDYVASLFRLGQEDWRIALPGHGGVIDEPNARIAALIAHRRDRESRIRGALGPTPATVEEITHVAYRETPEPMLPLAARNCLAHLIDLQARGLARSDDPPGLAARFASD